MALILLTVTQQLATTGKVTKEQEGTVSAMLKTGNTIQEIETYLIKEGHILLGKDKKDDLSVVVINADLTNEEVLSMYNKMMSLNNL